MKPSSPLVSVLMPTYNNGPYIAQAIESVLRQTMPHLELIVTNNASTDETAALLDHYAAQDSRVKVLHNPANIGLCPNFNLTFQRMDPQSQYFIFLPSDDWWEPQLLERLLAVMETDPELTFVHADGYRTDEEGKVLFRYMQQFSRQPLPGPHRAIRELIHSPYVFAQTTLVRRSQFARFYPHPLPYDSDLSFAPDYHLWLQLLMRGGRAYYLPERLAFFRRHPGSHTIPEKMIPRLKEEALIFQKVAEACPPEWEEARLERLAQILKGLGFTLIEAGNATEARAVLEQAVRIRPNPQLDRIIAQLLLCLPMSAQSLKRLWGVMESLGKMLKLGGESHKPSHS